VENKKKPKYGVFINGAEQLSIGISMVVAVAAGVGVGILMKKYLGYDWLLFLGIFWGLAAAFLNVKRAYDKQVKELDKLKDDPKYRHAKKDYQEQNDKN